METKEVLVLDATEMRDIQAFNNNLNKLSREDALEAKLQLLHILLPFCRDNAKFTAFLTGMRDELLGGDGS